METSSRPSTGTRTAWSSSSWPCRGSRWAPSWPSSTPWISPASTCCATSAARAVPLAAVGSPAVPGTRGDLVRSACGAAHRPTPSRSPRRRRSSPRDGWRLLRRRSAARRRHHDGQLLHDWGEGKKVELITKAYEALPSGGRLVVIENIIDDVRRSNAFGLLMSLNMLIETREGFDFTGRQFDEWCRSVGFTRTEVVPLAGPTSAADRVPRELTGTGEPREKGRRKSWGRWSSTRACRSTGS